MEITHVALWPQAESNRYPQLRRLSLCPLELCSLVVPDSHEQGNETMKHTLNNMRGTCGFEPPFLKKMPKKGVPQYTTVPFATLSSRTGWK